MTTVGDTESESEGPAFLTVATGVQFLAARLKVKHSLNQDFVNRSLLITS